MNLQIETPMRENRFEFRDNKFEGRYWNPGHGVAVVGSARREGTWSAYIGAAPSPHASEEATLEHVMDCGAKLTESEALAFFPEMKDVPYSN